MSFALEELRITSMSAKFAPSLMLTLSEIDIYSGPRCCIETAEGQNCSEQLAYPLVANRIHHCHMHFFLLCLRDKKQKDSFTLAIAIDFNYLSALWADRMKRGRTTEVVFVHETTYISVIPIYNIYA